MCAGNEQELSRQFRVLDQTLSMHATLGDGYSRIAGALDILLLACSVVFCATAFASDAFFTNIGLSAQKGSIVLKFASVAAFFASLVALRIDWKGKAARHAEAVSRLTETVSMFRTARGSDGTWPEHRVSELDAAYWNTMKNIAKIPESQFNRLKARHLRKVQISKMCSSSPGCPVTVLRFILFIKSIGTALKYTKTK
ncbi:MAG: hypothetical protein ACLQPD_14810 [Desulfomonilaceae bacterium]